MENIKELMNFIQENKKAGGLNDFQIEQIKNLNHEYKLLNGNYKNKTVVSAELGYYGSISIKKCFNIVDNELEVCNQTRILFTDYSKEQPYNRNGVFYGHGSSFDMFDNVKKFDDYQELSYYNQETHYNLYLGELDTFDVNTFYKTCSFKIIIENDSIVEYLKKLRLILSK